MLVAFIHYNSRYRARARHANDVLPMASRVNSAHRAVPKEERFLRYLRVTVSVVRKRRRYRLLQRP